MKSKQANSNQIKTREKHKTSQTKRINSRRTDSIKTHIKPTQLKSNPNDCIKWTELKTTQTNSNQIKTDRINTIKPEQNNATQTKTSQTHFNSRQTI